MSDQDNIFGGTTPTSEPQAAAEPAPVQANPWADKLGGIRNEAGEQKYADVGTALDALNASQEYIPQLQGENAQLQAQLVEARQELAKHQGFTEAMQQLGTPQQSEPADPQPTGLSVEQAEQLFEQKFSERDRATARKSNLDNVISAMREKYGDKAEDVFYGRGEELGMSRQDLNSLAGTSPQAVLALYHTTTEARPTDVTDVSAKTSVYIDPDATPQEVKLGRNDKSILMGSTAQDVRKEFQYNKELVQQIHKEGGSVEELTDPKMYFKYFGSN